MNGYDVVIRGTFLEVIDVKTRLPARKRASSDSLVIHEHEEDEISTVADSESNLSRGKWGCELDLEDAGLASEFASPLGSSRSASPTTPAMPPGVFSPSPLPSHQNNIPSATCLLGQRAPRKMIYCENERRTTLMLRNLPSSFTQAKLVERLNSAGLVSRYDFVYLPVDFQNGAGLGYAFVNMLSCADAKVAIDRLNGFTNWGDRACHKVLEICWSDPHQGLDMLIDRYRNSRVMHRSVPEEYKPLLLKNGEKVSFPTSTKRVRSPL